MLTQRTLKTLAVMAVLMCLTAVPALAETPTGRFVLVDEGDRTLGKVDLQTAMSGSSNFLTPLNASNVYHGEHPTFTPDGQTAVYSESFTGNALYSLPLAKSVAPTPIFTDPNIAIEYPVVSPDGKTVYFQGAIRSEDGILSYDIYSVPIEGGDLTRVTHDNRYHFGLDITPDGEYFVYYDVGSKTINVQPVGGGPATALHSCPQTLCNPDVSPDGTKVAFTEYKDGGSAVYTVPFSATGEGTPTKVPGSEFLDPGIYASVAYSPDGRYIAYDLGSETRVIPVGGGDDIHFVWGEEDVQMQVAWAPPSSDTTAPQLVMPDITVEATDRSGARITLSPEARPTDDVDPNPSLICTWRNSSGVLVSGFGGIFRSSFPIRTTRVNCTAEDASGNTAIDSFDVTVQDTTAPTITGMPTDIVEESTGANGAQVFWSQPSATDLVDGSRPVNCTPASGTNFALGETTVSCTATDLRNNTATKTFKVTVQDTTAPEVDAVDPDGTKVVPRNSTVTASFSEAVQAATLTSNTVQLFPGKSTKPIKATLSWDHSTDPTSVTLTPSSRLDAKTRYTAKIKGDATGVKDLAGNPLASDFSWSFTTGSQ